MDAVRQPPAVRDLPSIRRSARPQRELWRGFAGVTLSSILLLVVLLLPIVWRLLDRSRQGQQRREALLQRSVDASDDERRRIAGTLHDGVVQDLVATAYGLAGAAERTRTADPAAAAELDRASETVAGPSGVCAACWSICIRRT